MLRYLNRLTAVVLLAGAVQMTQADGLTQPYNQISFNVFAERDVPNDWTTAIIGTTSADADPSILAARINKQMNEALAIAQKVGGVKVTTASYNTYPEYGDGNRIIRWRASQDLVLESRDTNTVAKLLGTLQEKGLMLRNIAFTISRETRLKLEDELTAAAITIFRARAAMIARNFGKTGYVIAAVNVGDGGYQPQPMPYGRANSMMMAVDEAMSPEMEGGSSQLRVDVSGTIELQ